MMKKISLFLGFLAIMAIIWTAAASLAQSVQAQESVIGWSDPLNLSQSGNTTDPRIVADAFGRVHVLWQDDFAGLVYTQKTAEGWSSPEILPASFAKDLGRLVMVPDSQGIIHSAWVDGQGNLFYSNVPGDKFANLGAWITPQLVGVSVSDFTIAAAPDGRVHLAFSRSASSADFPAGIYARFSSPASEGWSLPRLVYASPYLRGLEAGLSQLSLAADPEGRVYLAWDVTPQEKVFLAVSSDGGSIWADAQEIDRRLASDGGSTGPSRPTVIAGSNGAAVTWLAGHQGANCAHYYRQTTDAGQTWSEAAVFPAPFDQSCAQRVQALQSPNQNGWLALTAPAGVYLLAWDPTGASGGQLSTPILQPALSGFINPETYRQVSLACRSLALNGNSLVAVACEADRNGDIWGLERQMEDPATWFPTPTPLPIWSTPAVLARSGSAIHTPAIVSDAQGRLHTFWTQEGQPSINYALWDGEAWTPTIALLSSPGGAPQSTAAILHSDGQIYLVWSDPISGSLFFSRAPTPESFNLDAWDVPQPVPLAGLYASEARLVEGPDNGIYLAAAVPLNEGRGIYLVRGLASNDPGQGVTWSAPEVVFDAVAAGWGNLGSPRLVFDGTGGLNMSWIQRSLPPNSESLGLTASRAAGLAAEDSAQLTTGWSEPQEVVRGLIFWSEMVSTPANGGSIHQAWQQLSAGQEVLFHQFSADGGLTWSEAARITGLENTRGPAGMAVAADGSLNLVQAIPRLGAGQPGGPADAADWAIQRWTWQAASGWQAAENQPVPGLLQATAVALAAGSKGVLGAWLNGLEVPPLDSASGSASQASEGLFYMGRLLTGSLPEQATPVAGTPVPGEETGPQTTLEGEELVTPAAGNETPLPGPTPTLNLNTEPPGIFEDFLSGRLSGLLLSVLPVLILVGVVIIVSLRKLLRK